MKPFLLALAAAYATTAEAANPIRKVVTLLEKLKREVEAEGEKEAALMKDFECYCTTNEKTLAEATSAATEMVPQLQATIQEGEAVKERLNVELMQHKADRNDAGAAIAKADSLRAREQGNFEKTSGDARADIAAIDGAVAALERGTALLQGGQRQRLTALAQESSSLAEFDRQTLASFLSTGAGSTSEIVGILKTMRDEMDKDLGGVFADEETAVKSHAALVAAKKKEMMAASASIERKTQRVGEVAVEIVSNKGALADTKRSLSEDERYATELKESCTTKSGEWGERQKTRSEELAAIHDTIKVLNDDESLELFNKTAGGSRAFLQVASGSRTLRARALRALSSSRGKSSDSRALETVMLALRSKKQGFEAVTKMIDDLVDLLHKEQSDDDAHRDWCVAEFDSSADQHGELKRSAASTDSAIEGADQVLGQTRDELKTLQAGIRELDSAVQESTQQRRVENEAFTQVLADNSAAKKLLEFAKNRLHKFYNPALYKAPEPRQMTEEDRVFVANGGQLEPTPAPGGIAGTGITVFAQIKEHDRPEAGPEPFDGDYQSKQSGSGGVVALIDMLIKDLSKEIQQQEHDEKTAQRDYEALLSDAKAKRSADAEAVTDKQVLVADTEEQLQNLHSKARGTAKDVAATEQYISSLHASCDFLQNNFDLRKAARASEVAGLKQAKSVLAGADFALLQTSSTHLRASSSACDQDTFAQRVKVQNRLAGSCEDMCKSVGSYPNCPGCPRFVKPDETPGVMTWEELYAKFDELTQAGRDMLKQAHKVAN